MSQCDAPAISVILVTPDGYETIRKTVWHLRQQTVRERLELVIVAPLAEQLALEPSELKELPLLRVVEVGRITSTGEARAAGIRAASAPVVVLAENHSYPEPDWARALIEAHRGHWAAVGAVLSNANPESAISWAGFFTSFGPWIDVQVAATTSRLPWHSTSYKRAILLEYGPRLGAMLDVEVVLHWDLVARGYLLYLEPAARTCHLNITRAPSFMREQFYAGRAFAAARTRYWGWSTMRRLLYSGGALLTPMVRLGRLSREIRRTGRGRDLPPGIVPALLLGLAFHALGELVGYVLGAGNAVQQFVQFELHKERHMSRQTSRST